MFVEHELLELCTAYEPAEHDTVPILLRVTWLDSIQPSHEWSFLRDLTIRKALRCQTIGYFCGMSSNALLIAASLTEGDDWGSRQVNGVMTIPLATINKIELYE